MKEENNGLRAILIDPFKEKVRVAYPVRDDYMAELKKWMEISCIDIVTLDKNNMLVVDDDGLVRDPNRYFHWAPTNYNFAGKAVILGYDEAGETVDCTYVASVVEDQLVKWIPEGYREEPFMKFIPLSS
jgi:hypothetical protein